MNGKVNELKELREHVVGDKLSLEEKKLKERYGVMREIPEQKIEEEPTKKVEIRPRKYGEETIPTLLLRIERLGAQFEIFNNFRRSTEERMSQLAEEIGELRSTFLGMEKKFTSLEVSIEKTLEAISGLRPKEIKKQFEEKDKELLELNAKVEKNKLIAETLQKQNSEIKSTLEKIKDLENILNVSRRISSKLAKLDETKLYVDRIAAKVEAIFSELNEKLEELEAQREKLKRLDELNVDIVKSLDEMSIKFSKFIRKDEANKIIEAIIKDKIGKIDLSKTEQLANKIKEINEKSLTNENNIMRITEYMKKIKEVMKNMSNVLSERLNFLEKVRKESEVYFKFSQILNVLYYTYDTTKIRNYLNELRGIVSIMKEMNLWNDEIAHSLTDVLKGLAQAWASSGQSDTAEIYKKETYNYLSH